MNKYLLTIIGLVVLLSSSYASFYAGRAYERKYLLNKTKDTGVKFIKKVFTND